MNDDDVQRRWRVEFGTTPPTRATITRTRDKLVCHKTTKLRDQIEQVINDIPFATIQTVCRSVPRCCWECTVAEGGHFEHVRA